MTDLTNKTVEELHTLFAATSHDLNTAEVYHELVRRLEEAQTQLAAAGGVCARPGLLGRPRPL